MLKKTKNLDKIILVMSCPLITSLFYFKILEANLSSLVLISLFVAVFVFIQKQNKDKFTKEINQLKADKHNLEIKNEINEQMQLDLTKANEELKDFAYTVSHDLKAPLRAISSLAAWIHEDNKEKLDEESLNNMNVLISRTKRMGKLIEGILECSRIGQGKELLEEVDSNEILVDVIDSLGVPDNFNISLENEFPKLVYDRTHLHQIFQNLISNAIKYIDKPFGEIKIFCTENQKNWEFCVQDNGPGIDKKHHDRIFKIFQTLQARDKLESTGVGLTVIKKIVETHGGEVKLRSVPSKGSSFYFTILKDLKIPQQEEKEEVRNIELRLENKV